MKLSEEKIMRTAERTLKRTKEYQQNREFGLEENYQIIYVLAKGNKSVPDKVTAFAGYEDEVISFPLFKEDAAIWHWGFNFERDLFGYLESGYELVGMTAECHYDVWSTIEEWGESGIDNKKGMQKYLAYCKRNGISKEKLQKQVEYSGMDVMSLYDPKADRIKKHEDLER